MEDHACPYLKGSEKGRLCDASMTKMSPSTFEFNIYCATEEHYRCPILLARTLRDGFRGGAVRAGAEL